MKRSIALSAVATLGAVLLTACGADQTAAYCDDLEQAQADIQKLQEGDVASFDQVFTTIEELTAEAPDDVEEDWKTLDSSLDEFEKALNDAGLELSDMEGLSQGEIPQGLDQEKLATLGEDLQELNSEEAEEAADNIEQHAQDECDIDLDSGSGGSEE